MTKAPTVKFPRIQAGFYSVTKDGEQMGYIVKQTEGKETNWYIFDDATPDREMDSFDFELAIDGPNDLFREAKEEAIPYFQAKEVAIVEAEPAEEIEADAPMSLETLDLFEESEELAAV